MTGVTEAEEAGWFAAGHGQLARPRAGGSAPLSVGWGMIGG
ncbi:hypothetical protein [Streptomyces sp. NPDC085466]